MDALCEKAAEAYETLLRCAEPLLRYGSRSQALRLNLNLNVRSCNCNCNATATEIHGFQKAMALIAQICQARLLSNSGVTQAKEENKKKIDLALRPTTRIGMGRPVYSIAQLVKFMMLTLG